MKITIIAIGKCKKNSPEKAIIDEYVKRCSWKVEFKEADNSTQEQEAKFLQSNISSQAKVIVLDERGNNPSSRELANRIEDWQISGCSEVCFLIGGADGHLQSVRDRADYVLSFGKMTLPHILMRAVLAEQIYRLETIIKNHPYHRD